MAKRDVFVEADEASCVSEVAAQNVAHWLDETHRLLVVVYAEHR